MALRETLVTLAHGGGGKAMRDLIEEVFTDVFEPPGMEDQARLEADALAEPGARLAFTTDSYVVTPVEFPGGDIGKIAVAGTKFRYLYRFFKSHQHGADNGAATKSFQHLHGYRGRVPAGHDEYVGWA